MVNDKRIVSSTAVDLLTLYSVMLTVGGVTLTKIEATDPAEFEVTTATGTLFASEPVKTITFGASVASATVYFVPAYDFSGFKKGDEDVEITGDVEPDGRTLYKLTMTSSAATVEKIGL